MLDTKEAREICDRATPGPWEAILWPNGEFEMCAVDGPQNTAYGSICSTASPVKDGRENECFANATFIAYARTAFPEALDRIEALEWLVEVQTLYLQWMHSSVRLVQFVGWRSELSDSYVKALAHAGYGG